MVLTNWFQLYESAERRLRELGYELLDHNSTSDWNVANLRNGVLLLRYQGQNYLVPLEYHFEKRHNVTHGQRSSIMLDLHPSVILKSVVVGDSAKKTNESEMRKLIDPSNKKWKLHSCLWRLL